MHKCEWRDGEFTPCLNATGFFEQRSGLIGFLKDNAYYGRGCANFCPFCGADIRKPEPEVIIKRSGETWVARHNGIDYLYAEPKMAKHNPHFIPDHPVHTLMWKPISEIEITDEIAKLRPFVIIGNGSDISTLAMVRQNRVFNVQKGMAYSNDIKLCRLATVEDLE